MVDIAVIGGRPKAVAIAAKASILALHGVAPPINTTVFEH